MDFVHDQLMDGRAFRVLTVVDQWSRQSPILEVGFSLTGQHVVAAMEAIGTRTIWPQSITVDHGSECISKAVDASFGSFDQFKKKFGDSAAELFGSGWTWLVKRGDGTLAIEPESNADAPLGWDHRPLLTLDVWEHAYYIDYRNKRPDFIKAFWNVVNWDFAGKNFGG